MKRLNVILEDEDAAILEAYQKEGKIGTRDEATRLLLREFKKLREAKA